MKAIHDMADMHRQFGNMQRARDFATLAWAIAKAGEQGLDAAANFARKYPRVHAILSKAAVEAQSFDYVGWTSSASGEALDASTAFLESLATHGVFDAMLPSMLRLPSGLGAVRIGTSVEGAVVGEGLATPMTFFGWQTPVEGDTRLAQALVVLSNRLLDLEPNAAISLVERELRRAAIAAIDTNFIAEIVSGVSPTAATGQTAATLRTDLASALARMQLGTASRPFVIMPSTLVRRYALMGDTAGARAFPELNVNGGTISGLRVLPTDVLTTSGSPLTYTIYVVDAARVAAWSTEIGIARATHAAIQMDDEPTNASLPGSPSTGIPTNLVSLWQTNATAIRVSRWWHARRLADTAVAAISELAA